MSAPVPFEMANGYACCRLEGELRLEQASEDMVHAVELCRQQQVERLLVDLSGVTLPGTMDTMDRFRLAERMAGEDASSLKVALVVRPEMLDPQRFGVTVARNRGLFGQVFTSESEAVGWLLDPTTR